MNFNQCKEEAKRLLKGNWLIAFAIMLLWSIVTSFSSTITGGIIALILSVSFNIAIANVFICAYFGKGYELNNMFNGYDKGISNRVALSALKTIFIFLWSLLFIIPGIVKSYSYYLADFISRDNPEKTATECLDESKKIMDGHKMDLFLFDLSFIGWHLLSILTCGILYIYVAPYVYQARIIYVYNNIYKFKEVEDSNVINAEIIESKEVNYCSNCGTKLEENTKFCPNCGNKVK